MYTGPHIVNDDLVFGYDTGYGVADNNTSTRFYPGRPTTNMASPDLKDWGTESSAERIATGNYYKGQPTYNCRTAVGSHWLAIYNTVSNLRTVAGSGGTVTMSIWVRNNNSSTIITSAYMGHDFSSNISISPNSDWQRIQWTVNQSSMNSDYCEFRPNTGNTYTYLEFTMPQIEVNVGTATPWTSTSRSNTQSLIDLTRTTGIDVSNVSFDSTGQSTFDGTDDEIDITFPTLNSSFGSIEVIVARKDTTANSFIFGSVGGGTNRYYLRHAASTSYDACRGNPLSNASFGTMTQDKFYHLVMTWNANTIYAYTNGELMSTSSYTNPGTSITSGNIGQGSGNHVMADLPVFKIHNQILSATEIKNNYKAYKNRFDL